MLCLVAIGAGLYLRNEHRKTAKLAIARTAGLAAFKAGDYRTALDQLKTYTWRVRGDNEALYAYAVARSRIETPNGSHITESISALTTLLQQDPGNLDADHRLLELYVQVFHNNDAVDLADSILADHHDDLDALHGKCVALDRLHKLEAALAASQKLNVLEPTDLEQELTTYKLMRGLKRTDAELIARAQTQQRDHAGDPRFELLLAWVYGNAGDMPACLQWLKTATTRPAPDATYVRYVVRVLDQLKMYRESETLLDRAVAENPDPQIMRVLIQRLWQSAKFTAVIDRLKDLSPASPASDSGLLAYLALSQVETGNVPAAQKIVAALGARNNDPDAIAWSITLTARFNHLDPKSALAQYEAALVRSPDNAVIRFFVGEAYSRMGETELAMAAWKRAAELSPSWMMPHLNIARTLAGSGRAREAVAEAEAARRAAPDQLATITALATIRYQALDEGPPDASAESNLLALITDIQKQSPGEPGTLPAYVNLLARAGKKQEAIDVLHAVTANVRRYEQPTLLQLVAASRAHGLGLENELLSTPAAREGDSTPRVALAQAANLADSGKPLDGLTLLQNRAKKAATQPVQWQLAIAQYKEIIHDPSAIKQWTDLADANPDDLSVQNAVLKNAISARADRDFIARTIDRVRNLTGPEGQTWKLERARWLIGSGSAKDAAEAVNTLSEIVRLSPTLTEARLLLAAAYETVGNLSAATKELQQAADQDQLNDAIACELARLLQLQNRFVDARIYLERAASIGDVSDEARMRLAGMLAAQGEFARAASIMEASKEPTSQGQLLLADLYHRQGRSADAEAVYTRLLAEKSPSIEAFRAAADYYGSQHQPDRAEQILARLPESKPRAGMIELSNAIYNERWGSAQTARENYLSATIAAPNDPTTWRHFIAFNLRAAQYDQAKQAADDALHAIPDDESLKRLHAISGTLAQLSGANVALRPVLALLAAAPEDRGVVDLLTQQDPTSQPAGDMMLLKLRDAAARYPRSLPIQTALVQWCVALQQLDEAADVARRTMESFPSDADSARIAATIYRLAEKYDLAATAARQWRQRSAENPEPADLMLAEIELARGNANAALQAMQPYIAHLKASPQENPPGVATLARAYALSGHGTDTRDLLKPLLPRDRAWRIMWLQIAGRDLPDPAAAAQWINEVEPMLADDDERLALGEAWYRLAARSDDAAALNSAAKAVDQIVAKPQPSPQATLLRALIADRAGDTKTAEINYRRTLNISPTQPEALNNLAYGLLISGGDLQEAKTLAAKAVAVEPNSASFYDTLARVQVKSGERDAAITSFKKAIELEPGNLEALVGLAGALQDAGQHQPAAELLTRIDELLKSKPVVSPQLRRELDAMRATTKASL